MLSGCSLMTSVLLPSYCSVTTQTSCLKPWFLGSMKSQHFTFSELAQTCSVKSHHLAIFGRRFWVEALVLLAFLASQELQTSSNLRLSTNLLGLSGCSWLFFTLIRQKCFLASLLLDWIVTLYQLFFEILELPFQSFSLEG